MFYAILNLQQDIHGCCSRYRHNSLAWSSPISHKTLQCGAVSLASSSPPQPNLSNKPSTALGCRRRSFTNLKTSITGPLYTLYTSCPPIIGSRRNVASGTLPRNSSRQCDRSLRKTMQNSCACFHFHSSDT